MCNCRVASVIKYKGDKAKKEFSIDNNVELNLIRNKYAEQLTTEDGKKILPSFFSRVARQKGYYDPQHKAYIQHDTSMDYLQTIVRRFKTKNAIKKPTSKLIDIFDTKSYREQKVNHKQISHIMKSVISYSTQMSSLFNNYNDDIDTDINDDCKTKYDMCVMIKNQLVYEISQYRIRYSTMLFILNELERKDYYKYRNILLPLLFTVCRVSFIEALNKSQEEIDVLVEGGNDLKLFDFSFNIKKNQAFFTKN